MIHPSSPVPARVDQPATIVLFFLDLLQSSERHPGFNGDGHVRRLIINDPIHVAGRAQNHSVGEGHQCEETHLPNRTDRPLRCSAAVYSIPGVLSALRKHYLFRFTSVDNEARTVFTTTHDSVLMAQHCSQRGLPPWDSCVDTSVRGRENFMGITTILRIKN